MERASDDRRNSTEFDTFCSLVRIRRIRGLAFCVIADRVSVLLRRRDGHFDIVEG
jgi:hypothetical protein